MADSLERHNGMGTLIVRDKGCLCERIEELSNPENSKAITQEFKKTDDVRSVMQWMQEKMGECQIDDQHRAGLQKNLYDLQESSGQLLPEIELKHGEVREVSNVPVGRTVAFDIWIGEYLGVEKCAIKVVRSIKVTSEFRDHFLREVKIWRKVWEVDKGKYLLPFWGIDLTEGSYPCIASPWMEKGKAINYIEKMPSVYRKRIIRQIAEGLRLLHSFDPPITHGDIRGANILIDQNDNPLLGYPMMREIVTNQPCLFTVGVSDLYRWLAPELCAAPSVLGPASDVFAYSMTVLELMTGQPPFSHIRREPEVLIKMQQGERPRKPEGPEMVERGLDDKLWSLLERCWVPEPEKRPSIHEVIAELPKD